MPAEQPEEEEKPVTPRGFGAYEVRPGDQDYTPPAPDSGTGGD